MIDIENEIFSAVSAELRSNFTGINVYSKLNLAPTVFPCVCVEEADNAVYRKTQDSGSLENHAEIMFEVNVYSSKTSGAKAECKDIFAVIDGVMVGRGFTRLGRRPIEEEAPITYRLVGQYRGIVSDGTTNEISTR